MKHETVILCFVATWAVVVILIFFFTFFIKF